MNGNDLSCECPIGFEEPYCSKPNVSDFYCDLNACKNGGICVHTDLDKFYGMKCLCQSGYTGIFCEQFIDKNEAKSMLSDDFTNVPVLCRNVNKKVDIKKQPIRQVNTPHGKNSYFLIQGHLIWYVNSDNEFKNKKNHWPKPLAYIFPTIEDNIDAIIFDNSTNEYLIFKVT